MHPRFHVFSRRQTGSAASTSAPPPPGQSTVRSKEAAKFRDLAATWWDPVGPFQPLHHMNPTRVEFMIEIICDRYGCARMGMIRLNTKSPRGLAYLKAVAHMAR